MQVIYKYWAKKPEDGPSLGEALAKACGGQLVLQRLEYGKIEVDEARVGELTEAARTDSRVSSIHRMDPAPAPAPAPAPPSSAGIVFGRKGKGRKGG